VHIAEKFILVVLLEHDGVGWCDLKHFYNCKLRAGGIKKESNDSEFQLTVSKARDIIVDR
jgi:hypothetical protein